MSDTLMEQLKASQMLVVAMTQIVAADHPGRVGAWTLRDIAAHLAATETECFEPRIRAMAAGERPEFEFYSNDERDFDGISLQTALTEWAETRTRIIEFVRGLSEEERSRVGVHTKFGELTVDGYLQVALDHDQDHLKSLERLVTQAAH
ncbi:MAG TPA: DinB family protein [Candidatus Dormibacteraeota bacterium]|nr:DinB family protein [Candidatus Dormibacteraeota bacterium]